MKCLRKVLGVNVRETVRNSVINGRYGSRKNLLHRLYQIILMILAHGRYG